MYVIWSGHTPTISALDCSFYWLVALWTWLSSRSTCLLKSLLRCGIYSSTFHQMYYLSYTEKNKFGSTVPWYSLPIFIMKDIKHYMVFHSMYYFGTPISIQHFLQNYLPWPIMSKRRRELCDQFALCVNEKNKAPLDYATNPSPSGTRI